LNIYEQLVALKGDLVLQGANSKTIAVVDVMLDRATDQQDSGLNFPRLQVLRRVMQTPQALNDEDVRLDLLALEGDLEDAAARREAERPAYEEERKPKLKKFYKKK
jgi:hypothetical protein